ncbi:MAG: hypothetical protein V2I82_11910 [Halieaceae bacterium]|nr:hypothetical protein [Halieaceae bacterium]
MHSVHCGAAGLAALLILPGGAQAQDAYRSLAGNMVVSYSPLLDSAESPLEVLTKGEIYGRIRSNSFRWDWEEPVPGALVDHEIAGLGGSIVFKSADYRGLGFTVGAYGTSTPWQNFELNDYRALKAGKDLVSRGSRDGEYAVIGEAFLQWQGDRGQLRAGRQIYESAFTASNDTKMIPNTFDGVSAQFNATADTHLYAAWFDGQKLRDHRHAHDVLTFRDANGDPWRNQDDAGVHRGLSFQNFVDAGQSPENELWIASLDHGRDGFQARLSTLLVPDVVGQAAIEASRKFAGERWVLTPAVKYFHQQDRGGGAVGGASLLGNAGPDNPLGYRDPDSLDGGMLAARVDIRHIGSGLDFRFGYTDVFDEGDLVAPWRGFPTGGYTRAMGQYNWRSNTRSWMVQLKGDLSRFLPWDGLGILARFADMDLDESKGAGMTDRTAFNVDLTQRFTASTMGRFRSVFVNDDGPTGYNEYRIELNYLF